MEHLLFIAPALRCTDCNRRTHLALIKEYEEHYSFSPLCPWHGFVDFAGETPTKEERAAVYASVERFVVAHYGLVGSALCLGQASLQDIPGYERSELRIADSRGELLSAEAVERMRFVDKAFFVRWIDGEGQAYHCWTIWDYADLTFRLIEQPLEQANL